MYPTALGCLSIFSHFLPLGTINAPLVACQGEKGEKRLNNSRYFRDFALWKARSERKEK